MDYQFKFQIETEDGELVLQGSTYISPTISEFGENESVDMEVGWKLLPTTAIMLTKLGKIGR